MVPLHLAAEPDRTGQDWPRFLGPTGDGKSAETILRDWPAGGLAVLWHEALGEGYSAPSVAGGRVFVFDRVGAEARTSSSVWPPTRWRARSCAWTRWRPASSTPRRWSRS